MAYSLVLTASFESDLDSVIDYHINNLYAPKAAEKLLDDLDNAIDLIQRLPTINALSNKPLLAELGYREQFVRKYVLVYHFDGETITVARMFHLRQDYERFFS